MTDRELLPLWVEVTNEQGNTFILDPIKESDKVESAKSNGLSVVPLYATPPKKEWVGLTDDEVDYFVDAIYKGFDMKPRNEVEIAYFERLIKFVGAKLEDKNT
jgi:hypothetical protein